MSNYKISKAELNDVLDIHKLNKECLPVYYSEEQHRQMIITDQYIILICKTIDTNIPVGYLISHTRDNKSHILSIGVTTNHRGKNVGKLLINELVALSTTQTHISLNVHCENEKAIKFYKNNNFTIANELPNYYGIIPGYTSQNGYYMLKKI